MWWHLCGDTEVLEGARRCSLCGAEGTFDGWRLSLWEAARVYHYVYGLNPFGPHRPHADLVLGSMRETCLRCGGRAVLTVDPETWCDCPRCEGTGGVWNRPFAEVDAVWRDVVARWPGAALPWVDARTRRAAPAADEPPPEAQPQAARGTAVLPVGAPIAPSRPRGVSPDGIKYDAVRRVFAQAQRTLGTTWRLSGRGHCERVILKAHYSRHARLGAPDSVAYFSPTGTRRYVFPAALVRRAASILKIDAQVLVSRWL